MSPSEVRPNSLILDTHNNVSNIKIFIFFTTSFKYSFFILHLWLFLSLHITTQWPKHPKRYKLQFHLNPIIPKPDQQPTTPTTTHSMIHRPNHHKSINGPPPQLDQRPSTIATTYNLINNPPLPKQPIAWPKPYPNRHNP